MNALNSNYITIDDNVKIYYEEMGRGVPIIFIPGWATTAKFFDRQLLFFSKNHRAISFDPRGHGRSSKPTSGNTYVQHGDDLHEFIEKLDLINPILVSWSWGCLAHFAYCNKFGVKNIKASIFVDGCPKPLAVNDSDYDWGGDILDILYWPREAIYNRKSLNETFLDGMLNSSISKNEEQTLINEISMTPDFVAGLLGYDAMFSDYRDVLVNINGEKPVMHVVSEGFTGQEWADHARRWIEKFTPSAKIQILGSHMMFREQADKFNNLLDGFLSELT